MCAPDGADGDGGSGVPLEPLPVRHLLERCSLPHPESAFFDAFVDAEVIGAIDALPHELREVIALADLDGLSYAALADVIGVPVETAKRRLFRGRRLLQERLYRYAADSGFLAGGAAPRSAFT